MSAAAVAPPRGEHLVRAAAIELAAGVVLFERVAQLAADLASPGYKADAGEREQLRQALEVVDVWGTQHKQLLVWAKKIGGRPAAQTLGRVIR